MIQRIENKYIFQNEVSIRHKKEDALFKITPLFLSRERLHFSGETWEVMAVSDSDVLKLLKLYTKLVCTRQKLTVHYMISKYVSC